MTAFATRREKFMIGFLKEENVNPTINFSAKCVRKTGTVEGGIYKQATNPAMKK